MALKNVNFGCGTASNQKNLTRRPIDLNCHTRHLACAEPLTIQLSGFDPGNFTIRRRRFCRVIRRLIRVRQ
jgi:hypothetical protein